MALADGIVDQFHQVNLTIFEPTQAATQLETSKNFCKAFLNRHNIPTTNFVTFKNQNDALAYLFVSLLRRAAFQLGKESLSHNR
ncbi:hypothetical protein [Candidatus Coxiella mudrowiae]|uniref:hypothetical protein n=1 Tax=Candidatus Coxiella mudrowiae TaxID=2054173 RepID=UPI0027D33E95|nr:hypothetical protein [Candidatus Coxiella mudrowiae]